MIHSPPLVGNGFLVLAIVMAQPSVALAQLGTFIDEMASEQQVVLWLDRQRVLHEHQRVQNQRSCHWATNIVWVLFQIQNGGNRDTKVGHRSPKVRGEQVLERLLVENVFERHCNK